MGVVVARTCVICGARPAEPALWCDSCGPEGTLDIAYVPGQSVIELKSLKYYLMSYRDVGIVQEHVANRILNDLVNLCQPRSMKVTLDYRVRGGIHTAVTVQYQAPQDSGSTS